MDVQMNIEKILVATQNAKIEKEIERCFKKANFDVISTEDVLDAIAFLRKESPSAFLLDSEMANVNIAEINRVMQDSSRKTALVVLSKNRKPADRIKALEEGADECLGQSEEFEELVAKVKALIRRSNLLDNSPRNIKIKDIEINIDTHEVTKGGRPLDLTYTQFRLLYLLVTHRDTIFSREEILDKVWGENVYVTDRTVDVHVKRLREKLGEKTQPSRYIQTIHGLGYRFA
jgi:DNA-binding response OmpR family regulator